MSDKETTIDNLNAAIKLLNKHDGFRYEAVVYLIDQMSLLDLKLITDHCIATERKIANN